MGAGLTPQDILTAGDTAEGPTGVRYQAHVAFSTAYDLLEQASRSPTAARPSSTSARLHSFNP
jgi:hypothetical protein